MSSSATPSSQTPAPQAPEYTTGKEASLRPLDLGLFLLIMLIWGINFPVAKLAIAEIPPILMMALRLTLVAVLLLPFAALPRGHWQKMILLSLLMGVLHFVFLFVGIDGIDSSTAALAIQLQVPFASLLAAYFFKDKIGWRRALGVALAFGGVAVLSGEPRLEGNYLSLAFVILGAFFWAAASIVMKKLDQLSGWTINAWMSAIAAPQLFLASWLLEDNQVEAIANAGFDGWFGVLWMAIVALIFAYGLWYKLLRRYQVNQVMPFTLLVPVFGVASSVLLLGDPLTPSLLIGGLLVVAGVAVVLIRRPKLAAPRSERI
ncbi:DMT family transporter [Rhodovibrionaceae bacterium A322]